MFKKHRMIKEDKSCRLITKRAHGARRGRRGAPTRGGQDAALTHMYSTGADAEAWL